MLYLIIPLITHLDKPFLKKKFQKFVITTGVISGILRYVIVRAIFQHYLLQQSALALFSDTETKSVK